MYLKLTEKLSPKKVAVALLPNLHPDQVDWDYENVYEWVYVDVPDLSFTLDVTRDHGMSDVDDEEIDQLSPEVLEVLPSAGATYIFGLDRRTNTFVPDLPDKVIQRISDALQSEVLIYPGRINIDEPDPEPIGHAKPTSNKS